MSADHKTMNERDRDKLDKLARLATDQGAPVGEWKSAGCRFFAVLRDRQLTLDDFVPPLEHVIHEPEPWWVTQTMPFGKYSGRTIGWVRDRDASYLEWILANTKLRSPRLARAIREALESCQ